MFSIAEVIFSKRGLDVNMIEREFELDEFAVLDDASWLRTGPEKLNFDRSSTVY